MFMTDPSSNNPFSSNSGAAPHVWTLEQLQLLQRQMQQQSHAAPSNTSSPPVASSSSQSQQPYMVLTDVPMQSVKYSPQQQQQQEQAQQSQSQLNNSLNWAQLLQPTPMSQHNYDSLPNRDRHSWQDSSASSSTNNNAQQQQQQQQLLQHQMHNLQSRGSSAQNSSVLLQQLMQNALLTQGGGIGNDNQSATTTTDPWNVGLMGNVSQQPQPHYQQQLQQHQQHHQQQQPYQQQQPQLQSQQQQQQQQHASLYTIGSTVQPFARRDSVDWKHFWDEDDDVEEQKMGVSNKRKIDEVDDDNEAPESMHAYGGVVDEYDDNCDEDSGMDVAPTPLSEIRAKHFNKALQRTHQGTSSTTTTSSPPPMNAQAVPSSQHSAPVSSSTPEQQQPSKSLQLLRLQQQHLQQQQQQQQQQLSFTQLQSQQQQSSQQGQPTPILQTLYGSTDMPTPMTAYSQVPQQQQQQSMPSQQPSASLNDQVVPIMPAPALSTGSASPSFLLPSTMMPPSVLASVCSSNNSEASRSTKGAKKNTKKTSSSSTATTATNKGGRTESPQDVLERILRQRGYTQPRVKAEVAAYDSMPSALQLASFGTELVKAVHTSNVETLTNLLACGLSPNPCNQFRDSILDLVCKRANANIFVCLMAHGCDLRVCDGFGRTPLHHCCWASEFSRDIAETILRSDVLQLLIEDKRGQTPLEYVRNDQAGEWINFLEGCQDEFFPMYGSLPPLLKVKEMRIDGSLPNPVHALPVPLAAAVSSGQMTPQQVQAMSVEERAKYSA